jgi:hypothetical protein
MNEQVFKLIQSLQLRELDHTQPDPKLGQWVRLYITWDAVFHTAHPMLLTSIIQSPMFQEEARKHLERFDIGLVDQLLDLDSSVRNLNYEADRFISDLRDRVTVACSKFGRVTFGESIPDESYVDVNGVILILRYFLAQDVYEKYGQGEKPETVLSSLELRERSYAIQIREHAKIFAAESIWAGNFARSTDIESLRSLEKTITQLRHEKTTLDRLYNLWLVKQPLRSRLSGIQNKLAYLVNEIDGHKYDVVIEGCCPT